MIPNLHNLCAYTCTSLLFNHVIYSHKGQIMDDMTALKRAVRYYNTLHNHEIVYRALQKNGMIGTFHAIVQRCGSVDISGGLDFDKMINSCLSNAKAQRLRGDKCTADGMEDSASHYYQSADDYENKVEVYRFLKSFEADIIAESKQDCYNKSRIMPWNDLTSIRFYKYDAQTNSFQPFDHRTNKKGK